MFNLFKKEKASKLTLVAPLTGKVVSVTQAPDAVFADKLLGDGIAIIPDVQVLTLVAPADGEIIQVADTSHAFGLKTAEGIELLIHIGLDTVEMGGRPFTPKVKIGDRVKSGQALCEVDFSMIEKEGYKCDTPVVITNADKEITIIEGRAAAGETPIIEVQV